MKSFYALSKTDQIERWRQAYRVLQNLPTHDRRKHWNMETFGDMTECGTVACAAGHCGMDPWFRRRGLKMAFTFPTAADKEHGFFGIAELQGSVNNFFGDLGTTDIFLNTDIRPVSKVMNEIARHISRLNACGPELANEANSNGCCCEECLESDTPPRFLPLMTFKPAKVTFE